MPLADVIRFLTDLKALVSETGKEIEKARGIQDPTGDYGLEILADGTGKFLFKGSVRASIAITRSPDIGALAVATVLDTIQSLNTNRKGPHRQPAVYAAVVHRLDKMAFINTQSKVEAKFALQQPPSYIPPPGSKRLPVKATFDSHTVEQIREYSPEAVFIEQGVTLYGKLFQLKDKSQELQEGRTVFWGELRLDNHKRWRVQFRRELMAATAPLFGHQVSVTGVAHYFDGRAPKLIASSITEDDNRDYEAAFDEIYGIFPDMLGDTSLEDLIDR